MIFKKRKTLFDNVSVIEAKPIIESMIDDFMVIVSNDNMNKALKGEHLLSNPRLQALLC